MYRRLLYLVLVCLSVNVFAFNGVRVIGNSPKQNATAGAGSADPQDASWLMVNPATIVDMNKQMHLSLDMILPDAVIEPGGALGNPNESEVKSGGVDFAPQNTMIYPLSDHQAFGIGMYATIGVATNYNGSRSAPGSAGRYDKQISYKVATLALGYAHKFENDWTLGFGPNINYTLLQTDMMTSTGAQTAGENHWEGLFGAGFQLGVYKKWDKYSMSLAYRSKQWTENFSDYDDLFIGPLDNPEEIQFGVAYKATDKLTLMFDYKWIDWDEIHVIGHSNVSGGFGWDDQHIYRFGASYILSDTLTVRSGLSFSNSPIQDEDVFLNSITPSITDNHFALGFTKKVSENIDIDLSWLHAFENSITDSGQDVPAAAGTELTVSLDIISLGCVVKF